MTIDEKNKCLKVAHVLGVECDTGETSLGWWVSVGDNLRSYSYRAAIGQIIGADQ